MDTSFFWNIISRELESDELSSRWAKNWMKRESYTANLKSYRHWQSQVETRAAAVVTAASTMVADRAGFMVHYRRKLKKEPVGEVEQEE